MDSSSANGNGKSRTIKPPGSLTARVSVACDRCRKKKIRCFYDDNDDDPSKQCANCTVVALQCTFSDKLARKAFPRGYTESLEERVRELEYENKKLMTLMSMKASPTAINDNSSLNMIQNSNELLDGRKVMVKQESPTFRPMSPMSSINNNGSSNLNVANLSVLNNELSCSDRDSHTDNCTCGVDHTLINRPVSIAGSVDIDTGHLTDLEDDLQSPRSESDYHHPRSSGNQLNSSRYSFEQINAPGAAAAISLHKKLKTKNFMNLANLIATSIPRSTDETLFIPTLLAKIVRVHGFASKAPFLTARSIALLKEAYNEKERYKLFPITFKGINFNELKPNESAQFFQSLNLPNHANLEICISIFFETWNTTIPILNKEIFMNNYQKFNKSREVNFSDGQMAEFEKFGELLVIITCLVMISNERNNYTANQSENSGNSDVLQFYDHLIKQFIQSNISSICCISSLQIKTIELLYCLTTGDLDSSYEIRGKMITMCQQMRLHRCPAAVLGSNGSEVSKLQQGERRILFWCIYTLESFSAFILGVPRLLKDYEIECALPSSTSNNENKESDINLITFKNNKQLSLVGKVCESALEIMRFSKVLGTIVDTIFKRNDGLKATNVSESTCLLLEEMLNGWLHQLPPSLSFELIARGGSNVNTIEKYSNTRLTLMFLYYQAKALIYMTLLNNEAASKKSPAFINTQQASTNLLVVCKILNSAAHNYYFMPLPMNLTRQKARFCLLAARNSLEYARGGSLFQEAKVLISSAVDEMRIETKIGLLGCLSENCFNCLELAIEAIFCQPKTISESNCSSPGNNAIEAIKKESRKKSTGSKLKNGVTQQPAINDIFSSPEPDGPTPKNQHATNEKSQSSQVSSNSDLFGFMKVDPRTSEQDKLNSMLEGSESTHPTPSDLKKLQSISDLMMINDFGVDASLGLSLIDFELDNSQPKKGKLNNNNIRNNTYGARHEHDYPHRSSYAISNDDPSAGGYGMNSITNFNGSNPDCMIEDIDTFKEDLEELNKELFPSSASNRPPSISDGGAPKSLFEWRSK